MSYKYYQTVGGEEEWKPIREELLDSLDPSPMFVTVLSLESPISEDFTREDFDKLKYDGPLYFDLDDQASPASTAVHAVELINNLKELGVNPDHLEIGATGGKGFHILVPLNFMVMRKPKGGFPKLPAIFKEMAFKLAVTSMDFRVYTAKRGRMFRNYNVQRPNNLYKVSITWEDLQSLGKLAEEDAQASEEYYKTLCSKPRPLVRIPPTVEPAPGLIALFDESRAKIQRVKKAKPQVVKFAEGVPPSFEQLLRGESIADDAGFHPIAMQVAIMAHTLEWSLEKLLEESSGLCSNHQSDGNRYNTPAKRRQELERMYYYMEDNPCYHFEASAMAALMTHKALDLRGIPLTEDEFAVMEQSGKDAEDEKYDHSNVEIVGDGVYVHTEGGMRKILHLKVGEVTALRSPDSEAFNLLEVEVVRDDNSKTQRKSFELEAFNSSSNLNKALAPLGQQFLGSEMHARSLLMRLMQKAERQNKMVYTTSREGLDLVSLPLHDNEDLHKPFPVWADTEHVVLKQPESFQGELQMRYVGATSATSAAFRTDLIKAPKITTLTSEEKEDFASFLEHLFACQTRATIGKLLGWTTACFFRQHLHHLYHQFPLLHINGSAGMGKTQMTMLFARMHYYNQEPKMLTPMTSTPFAIKEAASSSASIPLVMDEYKPAEMSEQRHNDLKGMLRDAYNCRTLERGGGTRESSDYRSVQSLQLSAPIVFIAEAVETEPALMERVVLLNLVKPPATFGAEFLKNFRLVSAKSHYLGSIGSFIAGEAIQNFDLQKLRELFDQILDKVEEAHTVDPDRIDEYSPEELERRARMSSRTAYNYAVVKFGLVQFHRVIRRILGQGCFDKELLEMHESLFDDVMALQEQATPEWMKVFNTFADMAQLPQDSAYRLIEYQDYAYVDFAGHDSFEIYANSCYAKYRAYQRSSGERAYFPNSAAFTHALNQLPALSTRSHNIKLDAPQGSHVFNLQALREYGFTPPKSRA